VSVVSIHGGPASIADNGDLVEQLEELLDRAKAGSITAMGMAFVNVDGSISTRWSGGDQSIPMIAAISMLQHEFLTGIGSRA
jgi:hypothetical protein